MVLRPLSENVSIFSDDKSGARVGEAHGLIFLVEDFEMMCKGMSLRLGILCVTAIIICFVSASYAADGLLGKWRAIDQKNTIHGFRFIPELKFSKDGTLYADATYGYRIIDEGKFVWELGNGIERVYKYQISGDQLMIYSINAPDDRARFRRVK